MPGGYRKGAKFEIDVRDILLEADWVAVRVAGSHGVIDVLAVNRDEKWFIQCRTRGNLSGDERAELVALAKKHNATPILAYEAILDSSYDYNELKVRKKKGVIFEEVKLLKPDFHYEVINGKFVKVEGLE